MASAPAGRVIEINPASAMAFEIDEGKTLRVVSVEGQQVGDFVAFNHMNLAERFSSGRTRSENGKLRISVGDRLFSNLCNVMFEITEDTCGVHDLLYPPCNRWVFQNRYRIPPHDGCEENLEKALSPWKITKTDIPEPFNIFENSTIDDVGKLKIQAPVSKAGDYVELRAKMDCLVAISACAVDVGFTNAGKCKPLRVILPY
jgi:uncharacterized protein YcgI (DUF1989 family)